MNGKQAKRLRKAAMGLAVHLDEAGKKVHKDGYTVQVHRKMDSASSFSSFSSFSSTMLSSSPRKEEEKPPAPKAPSLQFRVRPDSLKGIYKNLKTGKV